jgi:integrase
MSDQNPESQVPAQPPQAPKRGAGSRARKFPLFLHRNGQWCKKIRGKFHYFGTDKQEAYRRYLQQAAALHAGNGRGSVPISELTLAQLCNLYLDNQLSRSKVGEIKYRQYHEQKPRLKRFADFIGQDKLVADIKTIDLLSYRKKRIDDGRAPVTINNELAIFKAMFHWALESEIIERAPKLDAVKKIPRKRVPRQTFTPEEVGKLLAASNVQMRAMILLGLNCLFGCTDIAELRWDNLDLDPDQGTGRVHYPRGKTGVDRNFRLWPATVQALRNVPVQGELVFYTKAGNSWAWRPRSKSDVKPLTHVFAKLMKRAGIDAQKGTGFYTLRRTAATLAAETGDVFAVQGVLGHADLAMASTYVQQNKLTPQTDRAIEHTEQRLMKSFTNSDGPEPTAKGVTDAGMASHGEAGSVEHASSPGNSAQAQPPTATGCDTTL